MSAKEMEIAMPNAEKGRERYKVGHFIRCASLLIQEVNDRQSNDTVWTG